jgi:GDP-fucose protein O-fucosyltransferase
MMKNPSSFNESDDSNKLELDEGYEEDSCREFDNESRHHEDNYAEISQKKGDKNSWYNISTLTFTKSQTWIKILLCIALIHLILVIFANNGDPIDDEWIFESDDDGNPENERQVGPVDYVHSIPILPESVSMPYTDSLRSLCDATIWRPGLYLNCTNILNLPGKPAGTANPQGTFNVKNAMQTCVRWAIDGGMGFIIPRLAIRSKIDLEYFDEWADFSFLFDEDHLRQTMSEECPQLKIYDYKHNVDKRIVAERRSFTYYSPGWYRYHTNMLLSESGEDLNTNSIVIWENEPLFSWEFYKDGENVHKALYNAIKFGPSILAVGKTITAKLPSTYIGIHIRAEKDAAGFLGILNYDTQVRNFINIYKKSYPNIETIYAATGSNDIDDKFEHDISSQLGVTVITKWSLASKDDSLMEQLNQLRFDQLGIVDYEALRSSTYFFGMSLSSYTFGIAYERGNGNLTACNCHITGYFPSIFNCCF